MHILTTVVGERTGHWADLFAALSDLPGVTLTVLAGDVPARTARELDRLSRSRSTFRHFVMPHGWGGRRTGQTVPALLRLPRGHPARALRPDVVHVIGEAADPSTWPALRWRNRYWPGTPVTLYPAQNVVPRFPSPFPLYERYAYQQVNHAFPAIPTALEVLRTRGYRGPATIVPLGVDTGLFTPSPVPRPANRRFTAGFVGPLAPHTGVSDLLAAAERIDCDVLLLVDGPLGAQVTLDAARRPGRIHRQPWSSHTELPDLLARMDVLVVPAIEAVQRRVLPWMGLPLGEQFGRVLVEAMACGIPVIGSDVGGIPYVVGPAGLTFPAGDVTALAAQLARLRDDPRLARDLATAGVARATGEFCWPRIAASLSAVWRQLAQRPRFGLDDLLGGPREVRPALARTGPVD
ncbi:glycosyltransferase family 4 protein [Micromonospora sp. CPCC 206060]|uniref:glycosyltransferase family 4 protein n=1 Tax=Micromonospora sp. CPCC 206060 TaxID=3122406 RepID=UPI002FF42A3B